MTDDLRKLVRLMASKHTLVSDMLTEIASRIQIFQAPLLTKGALDSFQEKYVIDASTTVVQAIVARYPGSIAKGDQAEEQRSPAEIFEDEQDSLDTGEVLMLDLPKDQVVTARSKLYSLVEKYGEQHPHKGKQLFIRGEKVNDKFGGAIRIWCPDSQLPVQIQVSGASEGRRPHFVSLWQDGMAKTLVNSPHDNEHQIRDTVERVSQVSEGDWLTFIQDVVQYGEETTSGNIHLR